MPRYLCRSVKMYVNECDTLFGELQLLVIRLLSQKCLYYIILFNVQVFFRDIIEIVHVGFQKKKKWVHFVNYLFGEFNVSWDVVNYKCIFLIWFFEYSHKEDMCYSVP
jgi:hypothetical protein